VSFGGLERLFEQFFALVEAAVRLPPGLERRIAFRDVHDYGARVDQITILKEEGRRAFRILDKQSSGLPLVTKNPDQI